MTTNDETTIRPVVKTVTVPLSPGAAFDLFTARMGEWWPLGTHSVSSQAGTPSRDLKMTPEIGGEIVETAHDGQTHVWGRIVDWTPGEAFASTWHPGRSDGKETTVRVTFAAEGQGTRVTLTHSGWETLGDEGQKTRDGYDAGWIGVLERFTAAI